MLIKGRQLGDNITILNTMYLRSRKDEEGKWGKDKSIILYRDNDTGEKFIQEDESPTYIFYKTKDDVVVDHNLFFIEKEKVEPVEVEYSKILQSIAELTGNEDYFYENRKNGQWKLNNRLHTIPQIFNSDLDICDHLRFRFDLSYDNKSFTLKKAYFDIETDIIHMKGDFPELGECPINVITYIDEFTKEVHTFILRNEKNPQIVEFEEKVKSGLYHQELQEFIINHVGGKIKAKRLKLLDLKFKLYFYDEEIVLINDFFNLVNYYKPDFLLAWNMAFDTPYIIERIKALGYDPGELMCPKSVKSKIAEYYIDERNKNLPANKGDYYNINSHTVYLDQLVHFASRRKGQSAFDNNKLDYIGRVIAKIRKLDYSHITHSIAKFPYLAFELFITYNIVDTLVQYCIEGIVKDIDYVYNKCLINNTRYEKCHRQTIYLVNRAAKEFEKQGFIIGNNINRENQKGDKFPGALVGDPVNNNDYSKITINGIPVNIVKNLDDFDFKSLYPSIEREFNIAPNTQIGKIYFENQVHEWENRFSYDKYDRGGQFIQDLNSRNTLEFSKRWLHLASVREAINDIKEVFSVIIPQGRLSDNSPQNLCTRIDNYGFRTIESKQLFRRTDNFEELQPKPLFRMLPDEYDFTSLVSSIKETAQLDIDSLEAIARRKKRQEDEDKELEKIFYLDDYLAIHAGKDDEEEEE